MQKFKFGIFTNSQVTSIYYTSKYFNTFKGISIKDDADKEDENVSSLFPIASDMVALVHHS